MGFLHFRRPDYRGPANRWEPTDPTNSFPVRMPLVQCHVCGQRWGASGRIPWRDVRVDDEIMRELLGGVAIGPEAFNELAVDVRKRFNIPASVPIGPGTSLGPAHIKFRRTTNLPDFIWDVSGAVLVSAKALEVFLRHRVQGFETYPIVAHLPADEPAGDAPLFRELIVTGSAGKAVTNPEYQAVTQCLTCGFFTPGPLRFLEVSELEWDKTDLCQFSGLPRHRLAHTRFRQVVESEGLSNAGFVPLEELFPSF